MKFLFKKFFHEKEIDYDFCLNLNPKKYSKYLMKIFEKKMGYRFNLKKPETINEIIQYLKIYDNIPIKSLLTDKTKSGDYVYNLLNNKKIIKEVYGIYNSIDEVNFNKLPDKFIIKINNSCFANITVLNKIKLTEKYKLHIIDYYNYKQKEKYAFINGFELQYQNIPAKIIVERLYPKVEEYQILCTFGHPVLISNLDKNNNLKIFHLNNSGNIIEDIDIKEKIKEIIEYAKVLSKDFILVRIDFMLVNKQYWFFQEFTFTPYSGYAPYIPEYNDKKFSQPVLENMWKIRK